jgi:hypothetical protein
LRKGQKLTSKIKKSSDNVSFSLSRWFRRVSTHAPSAALITIVGISYAIFIFGGGLFTLINHPLPSAYVNGVFYFLYPDISSQFVADTLISVTLYAIGFMGLLAIYQSTKSAYKPRQAYMLLVIGVALLLLSYVFLEGSISFKTNGGQ